MKPEELIEGKAYDFNCQGTKFKNLIYRGTEESIWGLKTDIVYCFLNTESELNFVDIRRWKEDYLKYLSEHEINYFA